MDLARLEGTDKKAECGGVVDELIATEADLRAQFVAQETSFPVEYDISLY